MQGLLGEAVELAGLAEEVVQPSDVLVLARMRTEDVHHHKILPVDPRSFPRRQS
jgi:hypothetical protein